MIAFQSVITSIDYDALITEFSIWNVLIRMIIGTFGSLIVYLLIRGELIGGELFPELPLKILADADEQWLPSKSFSQLLIWSTVAGFSERLVPDRLNALALSAESKKAEDPKK